MEHACAGNFSESPYEGVTRVSSEEPRVRMATTMFAGHSLACAEIWQILGISRVTSYRYVTLGRQGTADSE
jgi:hypothetical protein